MALNPAKTYAYTDPDLDRVYVRGSEAADRGDWMPQGAYVSGDVVAYAGAFYYSLSGSTGMVPSGSLDEHWAPLVEIDDDDATAPPDGAALEEALEAAAAAMDVAEAAFNLAATGTAAAATAQSLAQSAFDLATTGTTAAQVAFDIATSGSQTAWAAFNLAISGTTAAAAAQGLAQNAFDSATSGSLLARSLQDEVALLRTVGQHATVVLCDRHTPSGAGDDTVEVIVPDAWDGGLWNIVRLSFRVATAGGSPSIRLEKSISSGAFSPTPLITLTMDADVHETMAVGAIGTVYGGDKLRLSVLATGTAQNWYVSVQLRRAT